MQKLIRFIFLSILFSSLAFGYSHKYIAKIQTRLTYLGFPCGEIDGKFGPNTKEAIKEFQRSIGKRSTGRISKGLYYQLYNAANSATAGFSKEMEEYNGIKEPD